MEKRFEPSQKRLRKALQDGNIAKSQYLSQSMFSLALCLSLGLLASKSWVECKILLEYCWTMGFQEPDVALGLVLGFAAKLVGIYLISAFILVLFCELSQVGINWETSLCLPQAKRINLITGLFRSVSGLQHLPHLVLRLFIVGVLFMGFFSEFLQDIKGLIFLTFEAQRDYAINLIWRFLLSASICLFVLGVIDYYIKRKRWFKNVGMSFEDLRNEHREEEGDPLWRAFRRARHEELIHQSLVKRVRSSKVILVAKQ